MNLSGDNKVLLFSEVLVGTEFLLTKKNSYCSYMSGHFRFNCENAYIKTDAFQEALRDNPKAEQLRVCVNQYIFDDTEKSTDARDATENEIVEITRDGRYLSFENDSNRGVNYWSRKEFHLPVKGYKVSDSGDRYAPKPLIDPWGLYISNNREKGLELLISNLGFTGAAWFLQTFDEDLDIYDLM